MTIGLPRVVDLLRVYRALVGCGEELGPYLESDARLIGRLRRHGACTAIRQATTDAERLFILRLQAKSVALQLAGTARDVWVSELVAYSTTLRLEQTAEAVVRRPRDFPQ